MDKSWCLRVFFPGGKETQHFQVLIGFLPPELPEVRGRWNCEKSQVPEQKHLDPHKRAAVWRKRLWSHAASFSPFCSLLNAFRFQSPTNVQTLNKLALNFGQFCLKTWMFSCVRLIYMQKVVKYLKELNHFFFFSNKQVEVESEVKKKPNKLEIQSIQTLKYNEQKKANKEFKFLAKNWQRFKQLRPWRQVQKMNLVNKCNQLCLAVLLGWDHRVRARQIAN